MSIFTVATSKGGAGKSTTAGSIAGAWAHRGERVLIIDLDENATLSAAFGSRSIAGITVASITPDAFSGYLQGATESGLYDHIVVDVAGSAGEALTLAIARANLTIIPAKLSRPDVDEACKTARRMLNLFASFGRKALFRVLINDAPFIESASEGNARQQIDELKLPRFVTEIKHRAPYNELFSTGLPPHFNDKGRDNVRKAIAEIDALTAEIEACLVHTVPLEKAMAS